MVYNNNDIMKEVFGGRAKADKRELNLVDQGHGIGIGRVGGSYDLYVRQLRKNTNKENGVIYIGKDIDTSTNTPSIINSTIEFTVGDIPKLLIVFHSLINELRIKTTWQEKGSYDIILESFYKIPSPYNASYDWWDLYSVYFIGPEKLEEGEYQVVLEAADIKRNNMSSTVEFTIIDDS